MRATPTERRLGRKLAGPEGHYYLSPGDRVRSWFRAPWYGTVTAILPRKDAEPLATVTVTHDRYGKPLRKPLRGLPQANAATPEQG